MPEIAICCIARPHTRTLPRNTLRLRHSTQSSNKYPPPLLSHAPLYAQPHNHLPFLAIPCFPVPYSLLPVARYLLPVVRQFEAKKNPKKMKLELTQIMTIRERATRKLLLEFNRGEITEDDGAKVEKYRGGPNPRNHPANVTETAEKSPKNQTRPKSPAEHGDEEKADE